MGAHPAVSIILPTYNREAWLREAIASVVAQTFDDWELIVADDGSTDGTRAFLAGIDDARIHPAFLSHDGRPTMVRVAAVRLARGDWLAFLDSDDLWLPDKLALQLQLHAAHPECEWSYGGYSMIDADGRPMAQRVGSDYKPYEGWILEPVLRFEANAATQTMLVRRTLFEDIGGFDESLDDRSDFYLAVRLASRARACALSQVVALIRDHGGRTTTARRDVELFAEGAAVFGKVVATNGSRSLRALGRRQRARQLVGMASALSREGQHRFAFRAIADAVRDAPLVASVWRAAAHCAAQAVGWDRDARDGGRRSRAKRPGDRA
jgi:glycosyltransferase involved in cell wall biosynthesis